jgi:ribonuclease-3
MERLGLELAPALLAPALVHSSWCAEHAGYPSNERLEFLGDAVLSVVIADHVYRVYDTLPEGDLTDIRKTVVNAVALAEVADELRVGDHLLLGRGEEHSGGREKPSILADALEAIIGAVYLAAGIEGARTLILRVLGSRLATAQFDRTDHKSRLQELSARLFSSAPHYDVQASGPDHARTFASVVSIAGADYGKGEGRSKKQAEQAAARVAHDALTDPNRMETPRETHYD